MLVKLVFKKEIIYRALICDLFDNLRNNILCSHAAEEEAAFITFIPSQIFCIAILLSKMQTALKVQCFAQILYLVRIVVEMSQYVLQQDSIVIA